MASDENMLAHYMRALDEIHRLRQAAALEAAVIAAQCEYSSMPKRAAGHLREAAQRLLGAARGSTEAAYADISSHSMRRAMTLSKMSMTLTRGAWEAGDE